MSNTNVENYKYADMTNALKDATSINYFNNNLQPIGLYLPTGTSVSQTFSKLDDVLKKVNIKRACCLQSTNPDNPSQYMIKIRMPGYNYAPINTGLGQVYQKYNFTDYDLGVDRSLCTSALPTGFDSPRGSQCQNFYTVYCKNVVEEFKKLGGYTDDTFNYDEFLYYKPECACFAPIPKFIRDSETNPAPYCYLPGCEPQSGVFLDPVSASPQSSCNLTICNANTDINNIAGRSVRIKSKITQLCGARGVTVNSNPILDKIYEFIEPVDTFIKNSFVGTTAENIIPGSSEYVTYGIFGVGSLCICCVVVIFIILSIWVFMK